MNKVKQQDRLNLQNQIFSKLNFLLFTSIFLICISFLLNPFWQSIIRLVSGGGLLWWSWYAMSKGSNIYLKIIGLLFCIAIMAFCLRLIL
jgi:hypothetical protein